MAAPTLGSNVTRAIAQNAQYIQERWTRDIQQPFDKQLQAAKLVQDRSGLVADGGDTLNVPFVAGVNARAKVASTGVTYDSPDGAPVTLAIDKHYYVAVLIEDIAKIQSSYDLRAAFQQRMAEGLARQVDTDLMGLYASAGTTVAGGATITDASILAIVNAFDVGNTPFSDRHGIVGHNTKTDLLGINKYVAYDQTGDKGVATHGDGDMSLGNIYGIDLNHSGNVAVASSNGHNLFFHRSAITLMQQKAPTFEMEYSVDYIGWKTVLHTVYGVGTERPGSLIDLTRTTAA
jgi:hypothetical protein